MSDVKISCTVCGKQVSAPGVQKCLDCLRNSLKHEFKDDPSLKDTLIEGVSTVLKDISSPETFAYVFGKESGEVKCVSNTVYIYFELANGSVDKEGNKCPCGSKIAVQITGNGADVLRKKLAEAAEVLTDDIYRHC